MKLNIMPSAALLLLCFTSSVLAKDRWQHTTIHKFGDKNYYQMIDIKNLQAYPDWNPETEPCPLPLADAIALARRNASRAFPEVKKWTFAGFSIRMLGTTDKWYYTIFLRGGNPIVKVDVVRPKSFHAFVGLDRSLAQIAKSRAEVSKKGQPETTSNKTIDSDKK